MPAALASPISRKLLALEDQTDGWCIFFPVPGCNSLIETCNQVPGASGVDAYLLGKADGICQIFFCIGDRKRFFGKVLRRNRFHAMVAQGKTVGRPLGQGGEQEIRLYTRSEEHTSELQSLMRISYAVFCLKKNKNTPRPKAP